MSTDRIPDDPSATSNEIRDVESILRDLEVIVRETLPPAEAEAYLTRLRHLLSEMGCDVAPTANPSAERTTRHD